MIEVLFGESEAGSMKCAKSRKSLCRSDGPVAVIGTPPSHIQHPQEWIPVPGDPSEVVALPYMLDMGDIRRPADSDGRLEFLLALHTQNAWSDSPSFREDVREEIRQSFKEYRHLLSLLDTRREIRIWYSQAPYALCGFCWLCRELYHTDCTIHTVELPRFQQEAHTLQKFRNWGEVSHTQFSTFLSFQKTLTKLERNMYAQTWEMLKEDNSPLRAVINGELTGVPEDFYDFLIRKALTASPIKEARLIGNILGKYPVLLNDGWYAARIEHMIQAGEIRILENSPKKYARIICRG